MSKIDHGRRRVLELAGGGTLVALAGCLGGGEAADPTTDAATGDENESESETMTGEHDDTTEDEGSSATTMRAVFHFSGTADQQNHAMANVANLLNDETVDLDDVVLVANGSGIELVLQGRSTVATKLQTLADRGVTFRACHNSLEGRGLSESDLLDAVEVVPAGVGELTKRQCEGYAYIKTP